MITRFAIAVWILLSVGAVSEESYQARFDELKEGSDSKPVFELLTEWRRKQPEDPDAWIASANYFMKESSVITDSTKPAKDGDYVIADPKSGKEVGSISFGTDANMTRQAIEFLSTASQKFPNRLDIWLGLASLEYRYGNFEELYKTLHAMADYSKVHADRMKWLKGGKLPEPADQFVPEQIHDRATEYYETGTKEGLEQAMKIARIAVKAYPNHNYAFNDMAAYYSAMHDDAKAREWMEKATAIDPADTLVLLNLGDVCLRLKDKAAARKYFQKVVDLNSSAEDTRVAKQALSDLAK